MEQTVNLTFHTKAISYSVLRSSSVSVVFPQTLSLSFSPALSMPKIHRMKEERGRERCGKKRRRPERGRLKPKIFISQTWRRQRGTFFCPA